MNIERTVQVGAATQTRQEIKAQLAQYLAQQSASKQTFHKWMKVVEMAGLAIIAGAFAVAMYVSTNRTTIPQIAIPTAWIAFPVSVVPLMILVGVHATVLRAFLPFVLPGKSQQLVTGSKAVWSGSGLIVTALAVGAFWGVLAWAVWSGDMALIETGAQVLGVLLAVGIPIAIAASLYQQFTRSR